MNSHWVEHKGTRVFIADFRGFEMDSSGLQQECEDIKAELSKQPQKSVRSISVVEGTVGTPEILRVFKNLLPYTNKYVARRAAVGLTGARRKFLDVLDKLTGGTHFAMFNSLPEALDWIVQDQ
jgi:predicted ATP-dependent serine protease